MLRDQILDTLKYFDVQDRPLTLLEISKYLLMPAGTGRLDEAHLSGAQPHALSEIERCIRQELSEKISEQSGFYFLSGRNNLAVRRLQNNFYASKRLRRIKKYLPLVRFVPFVSACALTGSEALANSKEGSDIDLLVLASPNRMWLTRLCMAAFFQIFGVRRYANNIADRFCLNHYIVSGKTLENDKNIYTAIEYLSLIPYFGGAEIFEFQKKNLGWMREYIASPFIVEYQTRPASLFKKMTDRLFRNRLGDLLEQLAGRLQRPRIKIQDYIIVEADELSFHPGSKGQQVLEKAGK